MITCVWLKKKLYLRQEYIKRGDQIYTIYQCQRKFILYNSNRWEK